MCANEAAVCCWITTKQLTYKKGRLGAAKKRTVPDCCCLLLQDATSLEVPLKYGKKKSRQRKGGHLLNVIEVIVLDEVVIAVGEARGGGGEGRLSLDI